MKKLLSVSRDLSVKVRATCPKCKKEIERSISIDKIMFKAIDPDVMEGAVVNIDGKTFNIKPPTVREFESVFGNYLRVRKIKDLDTIKLISLVQEFNMNPNGIEDTILNAKYEDITMLMALKDLYFNRVEPVNISCDTCNKGKSDTERRYMAVGVNNLIVDFFREIPRYNPVGPNKIEFKQARRS